MLRFMVTKSRTRLSNLTELNCDSAGKESTCNVGDLGSIPGFGRSPGEGKGYPLQYSDLENSMDYTVHTVAKSQTQLSDFDFTSCLLIKVFVAIAFPPRIVLAASHRF